MNRYGRGSSCGFTLELGAPADHPVALLIPLAPSDEHTKLGFCSGGAAMRPPAQVYQYDQQKREKPLRSCFQVFCSVFFYIRTLTIVRDTHSGSSFFFLFVCPVLHWNLRKTIRNFKWFKNKKSAKNVPYLMLKKKKKKSSVIYVRYEEFLQKRFYIVKFCTYTDMQSAGWRTNRNCYNHSFYYYYDYYYNIK